MPARTNEFQQLIHTIHRLLEPTAVVTESRLLQDHATGQKREVDIVIETERDGRPWLTSIECRESGRRLDVEWVEQLLAKHRDLPSNELILVSHNGFSRYALRKAQHYNVRALSLTEAINMNWTTVVGKLPHIFMPFFRRDIVQCEAHFARDYPNSDVPSIALDTILYDSKENRLGTIEQIGAMISHNPKLVEMALTRNQGAAGEYPELVTCSVPIGSYIELADRTRHEVTDMLFLMVFRLSERFDVPLQHASLGGLPVAYGALKALDADLNVTIIEPEGQDLRADVRGALGQLDPRNWPSAT